MTADGYTLTPEQIAAADARIKSGRHFKAASIVKVLEEAGVPATVEGGMPAMRAADRMIQAARKQGAIKRSGGFWTRCA